LYGIYHRGDGALDASINGEEKKILEGRGEILELTHTNQYRVMNNYGN
jgi:hypothetical protein